MITNALNYNRLMAIVKLKLKELKVNANERMVYYQISHNKKRTNIDTTIQMTVENFSKVSEAMSLYDLEPFLRHYKLKIDYEMSVLHKIIKSLESQHCIYTVADIKREFELQNQSVTFYTYTKEQIDKLMRKEKFGTAKNYSSTLNSFNSFLNNTPVEISQIDNSLILAYNDWLEMKHVSKNTISFYMRNLRAIYNRAVKEDVIIQNNPFTDVYTGVDKTRKLAIDEKDLYKLIMVDLKTNPSLRLARDLFVFSFCTRGMAFVDIAFLKKKDICKHMISYKRKKTGQVLKIKIEPCIKKILDKYEKETKDSEYIFPIIKTDNKFKNYQRYHHALIEYNRSLKLLAKLAKIEANLSSYSARHTWATIAHCHKIPLTIISEGMGHTSENTTKIYLSLLDNSEIDQANSIILKDINKLISF